MDEAQRAVDEWVRENGGYWSELAMVARMAEEVGEISREVLHRFGPKPKKAIEPEGDLAMELGDLVFIVLCLANRQGIDMGATFQRTLDKVRARDTGRFKASD